MPPRADASRSTRGKATTSYQRIYAAVRKIPRGKVSTYGAIARVAGLPRQPRLVGYALHALPSGTSVPWHRVINAQGRLSLDRSTTGAGTTQRVRLMNEGVLVDVSGKISLARFGWRVNDAHQSTQLTRGGRSAAAGKRTKM